MTVKHFIIAELCGGARDGERRVIDWTEPTKIITVTLPPDLLTVDAGTANADILAWMKAPVVPVEINEYEMVDEQYVYAVGSRTYAIAMHDAGDSLFHPKWTVTKFNLKREATA